MRMHITGIHGQVKTSTAQIAQSMVADIAKSIGFNEMGIFSYDDSGESRESMRIRFDGIIAGLEKGDAVIFQSPSWHSIEYDRYLVDHIKVYSGRIIIFVNDIISMMFKSNSYLLKTVVSLYNQAEVLIVPSINMKEYLLSNGVNPDMKFVIQEIWDYTLCGNICIRPQFDKVINFAGNPQKFNFINNWDYDIPLKLYSDKKCDGNNIRVMGWKTEPLLAYELAKGGFGLVWYMDENWHNYMKYNCTFKLSAYLAAGIPVIVPDDISNKDLILRNHLGIAVRSLDEAVDIIHNMTEEEYNDYISHINEFSFLLRNGYFTKKLLIEAIHSMLREE